MIWSWILFLWVGLPHHIFVLRVVKNSCILVQQVFLLSVITFDYWDEKLRADARPRSSSQFADVDSLSTTVPMRIWQQAGINSVSAKQATIVSWMYCGTYFTRELMHTMHKVKSSDCACNSKILEDIPHILLHCQLYSSIREEYIPKFIQMNSSLPEIL